MIPRTVFIATPVMSEEWKTLAVADTTLNKYLPRAGEAPGNEASFPVSLICDAVADNAPIVFWHGYEFASGQRADLPVE